MLTKSMVNKINEGLAVGMHLHELEKFSKLDRMSYESSPDGQNIIVEGTPSTKDDITRWAQSMQARLGITSKQAQRLAYATKVTVASTLLPEIRKEVENSVRTEGYEKTFSVYKTLALEMLKQEPKGETISFKAHSSEWLILPLVEEEDEEKTPRALYESVYNRFIKDYEYLYSNPHSHRELYNDADEYADHVVAFVYGGRGERYFKEINEKVSLQNTITKIRRAGTHQIGEMGKKLFKWSRDPKIRNIYRFEEIKKIWDTFKAKKEELKKWKEEQKAPPSNQKVPQEVPVAVKTTQKTKVVYHKKNQYSIYIGKPSKWGNPFVIGKDGSREEVIKKYEDWIKTQPQLLEDLHELEGKTLSCHCKPHACHGDVLVKLIEELT